MVKAKMEEVEDDQGHKVKIYKHKDLEYGVTEHGKPFSLKSGKELKTRQNKDGNPSFQARDADGGHLFLELETFKQECMEH